MDLWLEFLWCQSLLLSFLSFLYEPFLLFFLKNRILDFTMEACSHSHTYDECVLLFVFQRLFVMSKGIQGNTSSFSKLINFFVH